MIDSDTAKVILAALGGYVGMLSTLDLIFRVLVGAATLYYILLKIRKARKP